MTTGPVCVRARSGVSRRAHTCLLLCVCWFFGGGGCERVHRRAGVKAGCRPWCLRGSSSLAYHCCVTHPIRIVLPHPRRPPPPSSSFPPPILVVPHPSMGWISPSCPSVLSPRHPRVSPPFLVPCPVISVPCRRRRRLADRAVPSCRAPADGRVTCVIWARRRRPCCGWRSAGTRGEERAEAEGTDTWEEDGSQRGWWWWLRFGTQARIRTLVGGTPPNTHSPGTLAVVPPHAGGGRLWWRLGNTKKNKKTAAAPQTPSRQ